ncbi:MAG TPA: hypothetical protein VMF58_13655 [Rhizomicrobium sp.]|nr:hypothetical protein [Rhizomicrobium sp.]
MERARVFTVVLGVAVLVASATRGTEPDAKDVACLASVLRAAPNAISVVPAKDIEQHIYYSDSIEPGKFVRVPTTARGVDYAFRKSDGAKARVGVYIATQAKIEFPKECERDPHCVVTAMSGIVTIADNGRFQIFLRPDYPPGWYPWSKPRYEDSPDHPLHALWPKLAQKCKVDNVNVNSGVTP